MDFWTQHGDAITRLGLYAGGITAYTLIVTWLYVPMGHRLMFARRLSDDKVSTAGRRFVYVLFFPLVSFGFFLIVAGTLVAFNSKDISGSSYGLSTEDILVIAMAIVLAIRICAYVHETAADELAKVMPLGLLGLVLVTNKVNKLGDVANNLLALKDNDNLQLIFLFFGIVVLVEFLLRIIYELAGRPGRKPKKPSAAAPARPQAPSPVTQQRRP